MSIAFQQPELTYDLIKVFILTFIAFIVAFGFTPIMTHFLYKYKFWRTKARDTAPDGSKTPIFNKLHKKKEVGTPRSGGLLIWITVLVLSVFFWILSVFVPGFWPEKLNFISRDQTWILLFALVTTAILGFVDDFMVVKNKGANRGGGISFKVRLVIVALIGAAGAYWFYYKLGWDSIHIPAIGDFIIGWWYIPLFIFTVIASVFSVNESDGLDGLSAGLVALSFSAFAGIAIFRGQINIAAFCGVIVGATLAYLWFNIPPARFYMGDTGSLALGATLAVVAFLTNSFVVLPIIGIVFLIEAISVVLQLGSKRFRGKKIFLVAPIHHHFEAKGWPAHKVTMRFWVIGAIAAVIGLVIGIIGSGK